MSKVTSEAVMPGEVYHPKPLSIKQLLPMPVWIIAAILIVVGAAIMGTRTSRLEATTYDNISNCEATTKKPQSGVSYLNGLSEEFGLVTFKRSVAEVTQYFTLCSTEPKIALTVFRRALTNGNTSAKVIALHSTIFLAPDLDASDFQLVIASLADKSPEVCRVAQRAVSDLTVLKRADNGSAYEVLPGGLPQPEKDAPSHKIETRKETIDGQQYLDIRWSDPDLAQAWLKANAGTWDPKLHRFVVP